MIHLFEALAAFMNYNFDQDLKSNKLLNYRCWCSKISAWTLQTQILRTDI